MAAPQFQHSFGQPPLFGQSRRRFASHHCFHRREDSRLEDETYITQVLLPLHRTLLFLDDYCIRCHQQRRPTADAIASPTALRSADLPLAPSSLSCWTGPRRLLRHQDPTHRPGVAAFNFEPELAALGREVIREAVPRLLCAPREARCARPPRVWNRAVSTTPPPGARASDPAIAHCRIGSDERRHTSAFLLRTTLAPVRSSKTYDGSRTTSPRLASPRPLPLRSAQHTRSSDRDTLPASAHCS